jgi:spermidine synthase
MAATDERVLQLASPVLVQPRKTTLLVAVGLSSSSALLLEIALTRLFSVVLFYHFAFLAISIAMLGLGAGGVFAHLFKERLDGRELRNLATFCAAVNAGAIVVVLEIVLHVPVSLELVAGNFLRLSVVYLSSAVPFFLTGFEFAIVFARESSRIARLYGADLAGGAGACLAVVGLLNLLGAPNTILCAALVSAIAAVVWSPSTRSRRLSLALTSIVLVAIILNHSGRLADVVWAKGVRRTNVEFSRWNAISRVEVDREEDGARAIVIDADANTYIMNADPDHWRGSEWERHLMSAPAAVVNLLRPHGEYAIIGPGGGVDVLRAVANGSSNITGIEINGIIVNAIMRERYADFAYHLYQRPEVHLHVGDGRSFIRNARSRYDVLEMTLVDTWASTAAGAFSLSENNLYTSQAFAEYFAHLRPGGIVAVTRWEFREPREALRVVSVAADALHRTGVDQISRHFIVVSADELDEDGVNVTVLAKKDDFTGEEEALVERYVDSHPPLELLYSPSAHERNAFSALIESNDPYRFTESYPYNVTPVTDNAPFFFFTLKPERLLHLGAGDEAMDWKVNLGVAVLAMLLAISFVAVGALLLLPLVVERKRNQQRISPLFYFVAIGLGYVLVEVTLIQRFVLFLGHPTYAFSAVIFMLLLSGGAGSLTSRAWLADPDRVWMPLVLIGAALVGYVLMLPRPLERWVGAALAVKLALSAALVVPLGFAMGMPFPTGLRILEEGRCRPGRKATLEWAWAMNAAASVLGSVLAIAIAIEFGLNATLGCGGAAYLLALLLKGKLRLPAEG